MLFVIRALSERGVIERDEAFVDDGRFAVVAPRGVFLPSKKKGKNISFKMYIVVEIAKIRTYLVVVEMTIRPAVPLERAHKLQQLVAHATPETARMPARAHSADDAPGDRLPTPAAREPATTVSTKGSGKRNAMHTELERRHGRMLSSSLLTLSREHVSSMPGTRSVRTRRAG